MDIQRELLITPAEGLAQRLSGAQQHSSTSTWREKDLSHPRKPSSSRRRPGGLAGCRLRAVLQEGTGLWWVSSALLTQ